MEMVGWLLKAGSWYCEVYIVSRCGASINSRVLLIFVTFSSDTCIIMLLGKDNERLVWSNSNNAFSAVSSAFCLVSPLEPIFGFFSFFLSTFNPAGAECERFGLIMPSLHNESMMSSSNSSPSSPTSIRWYSRVILPEFELICIFCVFVFACVIWIWINDSWII